MLDDDGPIAELGYESDTGPRDNPTCANFENRVPVKKVIVVGHKVLNRTGRAICRIVHPHGWSIESLAYIFGVSTASVMRAIANTRYLPRDNIQEDYERVDPEFKVKFPPVAPLLQPFEGSASRPEHVSVSIDTSEDGDEDELMDAVEFRSNGRPLRAAKSLCYRRFLQSDNEDSEVSTNPR
ncbi:hypothetical protein B0H17DRAFT_541081 [Mycena rosella]|uniref:Uncharacterized protein n=1 Tax=Mycena rosella TaxID=1033263 RepID=A0AAD7GFH9_MYCRO|nr:hypothetical protein B0H17DRAFT_541081 [Mycena rosella]